MKIIIANTNIQALLKTADSVLDKWGRDDIPDKFRGQATLSALKEMFSSRCFSVCDIRKMAEMNDLRISSETMAFFETLHCVDFANMTEEMREYLFAKCIDLFKGNIVMANSNYETNN